MIEEKKTNNQKIAECKKINKSIEKYSSSDNENLTTSNSKKQNIFNMFNKMKKDFNLIKNENTGQGAAEYILLFGGVIVIAIAALMIYKTYFETTATGLNASNDVNEVRNTLNSS